MLQKQTSMLEETLDALGPRMNQKQLLPDQVYGDRGITNTFGIPMTPIEKMPSAEELNIRLKKIKDSLTVTEFEKIDLYRIIYYTKEEFTDYINLLNKVKDTIYGTDSE